MKEKTKNIEINCGFQNDDYVDQIIHLDMIDFFKQAQQKKNDIIKVYLMCKFYFI